MAEKIREDKNTKGGGRIGRSKSEKEDDKKTMLEGREFERGIEQLMNKKKDVYTKWILEDGS